MSKLDALPGLDIIKGFRGVIDYYVHRGIPCARMWPRPPRLPRSPASQVTAQAFKYIATELSSIDASIIEAGIAAAISSPLTWRDMLIRAYFGRLIAHMSIDVVITDKNGIASEVTLAARALESGGNLAAILAQLNKLIFDGDELKVGLYGRYSGAWKRQPLVFGFSAIYAEQISNLNAAAGANTLSLTTPPANTLRVITHMSCIDETSVTTLRQLDVGGAPPILVRDLGGVARTTLSWTGHAYCLPGSAFRAYFEGCTLGDDLYFNAIGYDMLLNL